MYGLRSERSRVLGCGSQVGHLRIRVGVGGGVPVHDPFDTPVDDCRVNAAVKRQVRSHRCHAFLGAARVQDLRLGVDTVGEQDLVGTEPDRVQQSGENVADTRAAVAVERGGRALRTGRIVEFPRLCAFGGADDRVFGGVRREVDARLVMFGLGELALGGNTGFEEFRLAVRRDLVAVGCDHAVTVRVHRMIVDPVAVVVTVKVELAGGDHRVLAGAVDGVFVYRERVCEGVILFGLLELFEGRRDDLRVQQADLRGAFRVGAQRAGLAFRGRRILFDLDIVQPVRLLGGVDIALDVRGFRFLRVRVDAEALHERRPDSGEYERDDECCRDGDGRSTPRFEGRSGAHTDRSRTFKLVGAHEPHAEHHAENRRQCGHDERDRNRGVDRGVGGAGDPVALCGETGEHAEHLVGRPDKHVEDQPDANLPARMLGDGEQAAPLHRHGQANTADQHMCDDGEDDPHDKQHGHRGHHETQSRQHEDVEPSVQAELRIGGAEPLRVEHEQDLRPVRVELRSEDDADNQGDDHSHTRGGTGADPFADFDDITVHTHLGAVRPARPCTDRQHRSDETHQCHEHRVCHP